MAFETAVNNTPVSSPVILRSHPEYQFPDGVDNSSNNGATRVLTEQRGTDHQKQEEKEIIPIHLQKRLSGRKITIKEIRMITDICTESLIDRFCKVKSLADAHPNE
ncbi:MAG: hypothetical protein U5J83_04670 [Bryobacterales bacterium]|nr:hypothetical protein [Bryobacterales bacterium]